VWGGCCAGEGAALGDGAAYDPAADRWRVLPEAPIPGRAGHVTAWTGRQLLIWGGRTGTGEGLPGGAALHPPSESWVPILGASLAGRTGAAAAWTGDVLLVWGGCCTAQGRPFGDGAAMLPPPVEVAGERPQAGPSPSPPESPPGGPSSSPGAGFPVLPVAVAAGAAALGATVYALRRRGPG